MKDKNGLSRREMLIWSVRTAAAVTTLSVLPDEAAPNTGKERLHEFPLGTVRLTGGPLKRHFDGIHAHYLALSNDRLLKVFRQRVGLPARARYGRLV
ncbi:MAG: hypothetical protein J2P31_04515 [Blastocatellia bacterium]|nr:hypothetical protein [Blastocatellia bacterium]